MCSCCCCARCVCRCLRSAELISGGVRSLLVGEVKPPRVNCLATAPSLPPLSVRAGGDIEYSSPPGVLHVVPARSTLALVVAFPPAFELRIPPTDPDDTGPVPTLSPLSRSAAAVRSVALVTRFWVSRRSSARRAADESSIADLDLPEVPKSLAPLPVRLEVSPKLPVRSLLPTA